MSLPLEVDFMIIERLPLEDALNLAIALKLPEQVAVQYFACDRKDIGDILYKDFYDLKPSSYKFLHKNKRFQVEADSNQKTRAAITLRFAAKEGHLDIVKLLKSHTRFEDSNLYLPENESSLVESDY